MFIKKAFKMACLAYNSSKVTYKDKPYSRSDLLKIRKGLLDELEL